MILAHDAFVHRGIDDRRRRICAHPAGVRPRISLTRRLVVLRRCQRHRPPAADDADEARFLADKKLLDHDPASGVAERTAGEHFVHGGQRLGLRLRDDDPLARRQPVRLDHDRRSLLANAGSRLVRDGELGVACGRNAVACEERLGERLRALHPRRSGAGTEDAKSFRFEPVRNPRDQRHFGSYDGEIDRAPVRERGQSFDVLGSHCDVLDPGLARGPPHCRAPPAPAPPARSARASTPARARARRRPRRAR